MGLNKNTLISKLTKFPIKQHHSSFITMKKFIKYFFGTIAALIAITYTFGYGYLFNGIAKTYLKGETSATIDDGVDFPSHPILAENPKPWEKDSAYNKTKLSSAILEDVNKTKTASIVIIKDGKLLHEEYFNGYNSNSKTNSFSMAKTVTSLLLGAAIDEGIIKSEDEKLATFFPTYKNVKYGSRVTLKNLVTMEAGLNWNEAYYNPFGPNAKAYYGKSLAEATLRKGFKDEPGKKFEYQSGATQVLGFALRNAVNMPISSYATRKLWSPLGMEQNASWTTDENRMEKTFCCIHANTKDYAKLGQLLLNEGKVDSVQVISKNYISRMITPTKESNGAYGYGIWVNNDAKIKHYYFWGILGQYIIIVPEKNLVIVRTGSNENIIHDPKGRPTQVEFLVNEIVKTY